MCAWLRATTSARLDTTVSRSALPKSCRDCPLGNEPHVCGYGVGESLMIIGEAPGYTEVKHGQPFVGESGKLLRATLSQAGIDLDEDVYMTNSVLCHPPGNKTPSMEMVESCASRLAKEIELVQPTKILAVGGIALTAVMAARKPLPITKWRGKGFWTNWRERRIYTVATYHPAAILRTPDLFRDFAGDIEKWVTHDAPMPEPKLVELVCEKPEHVKPAIEELLAAANRGYALISCDLETTGFSPISNSILAVGFGCELVPQAGRKRKGDPDGLAVVIPGRLLKASSVRRVVYDLLTGKTFKGTLGFHNGKFDLQFLDMLYNEGIRPPRLIDSMLLSYLLDERPIGSQFAVHSLKAQARIRYDAADYMFNFDKYFKKSKEEQEAELKTMHHYQAQDLYYTARLCREMPEEANKDSERLMKVHDELLIPASLAFTEVELHGSLLDFPLLKRLQREMEKSSGKLLDSLQTVAAKYGLEEFNPGSSKQVSKLLYDIWKLPLQKVHGRKGSYVAQSDKHGLNQLIEKLPDGEQKTFLENLQEYRAVLKELNTYVIGFMELAKDDERIRSNFQLAGTVTGRLSSWKPNLQNIPVQRGNKLRNAFMASEGMDFIAADFSQLEVRVAAALSNEEAWIDAFRKGYDLHKVVASQMLKKPQEDVTELERRMAKTVDFGILYGLGAKGLVDHEQIHKYRPKTVTLEEWHKRWNPKEAERFLNLFKTQFPKLTGWMDSLKKSARKNQFIEAPTGRRRRFPLIHRGNWSEVERQAANMPIQSAASDICLLALIRLHEELPEGAYVLFSVHDAIYVECEKHLTEKVLKQVKATMLSAVPDILGFKPEMPFDVKVEVGSRWAEDSEDWALAQKTGHKEKPKGGLNGNVAHARSRAAAG
jgi:uracil-DNA glycosylase family 4